MKRDVQVQYHGRGKRMQTLTLRDDAASLTVCVPDGAWLAHTIAMSVSASHTTTADAGEVQAWAEVAATCRRMAASLLALAAEADVEEERAVAVRSAAGEW